MRFKIQETESTIEWIRPLTGESVVRVRVDDVHPSLRNAVFRYGLKQIVADAGAMSKGASVSARIDGMRRRAAQLRDGTWGTRAVMFPDNDLFTALVECGALRDTDATRDAWRGLTGAQRRAAFAAAGEPARRALEQLRPATAPETGASVLAALMSASAPPAARAVEPTDTDEPTDDAEPTDDDADLEVDDADEPADLAGLGIDVPSERVDE